MRAFLADFRFALRLLARTPLVTIAAILSLALGIGANVTVFTWLRQTVLRPLPGVAGAQELVVLEGADAVSRCGISYPAFQDFRDGNRVVTGLFAGQQATLVLREGDRSQRFYAYYGSWNIFETLGVQPARGRFFRPEDDRRGQPLTVVLTDHCWRRRFGADPGIVGRSVDLGGRACEVLGVAPAGFHGPVGGLSFDGFVPLEPFIQGGGDPESSLDSRVDRSLYVMGRLKPGVDFEAARDSLKAFQNDLARRFPRTDNGLRLTLYPLRDSPMGAPVLLARPMALLFLGVAFLLLIATANVANLLLARAAARQRELAMRSALGASRLRLVRQLLTEGLALGLAGGFGGVVASVWCLGLFQLAIPPVDAPVAFPIHLDLPALAFALALSVATAAGFSLVPALRGSAGAPADALKEGSARGGSGPRHRRAQSLLVAAGMAVAVALLVAAALMVKSGWEIRRDTPGFEPKGVLLADLGTDLSRMTPARAAAFDRALLDKVRALPGVVGAALTEGRPLSLGGPKGVGAAFEDGDRAAGERIGFSRNLVGPEFFRTLRIPLAAGREFTGQDGASSEPVVMVNETLARRFWPGLDPVGLRLRINGDWRKVVGVCRDFKFQNWSEPPTPFVYLPFDQWGAGNRNLAVRVEGPTATFAPVLRQALAGLDPALPVTIRDQEHLARDAAFAVRASAQAMGGLGLLALFLAAVGIYSVMAHAVSQRTSEIGVRMAMGARPASILALVLRQGLAMAGAGTALGLAAAYALGQRMADLLHKTSPTEPAIFLGVPLLLLLVALAACVVPALRAARMDPVSALRD